MKAAKRFKTQERVSERERERERERNQLGKEKSLRKQNKKVFRGRNC